MLQQLLPQLLPQSMIKLNNRSIIAISGDDRFNFLQKLITNDLQLLYKQSLIYAGLLNSQGKLIADFFIFMDYNAIYLDCHQQLANSVLAKLNLYKLRANINLQIFNNVEVFFNQNKLGFADPRQQNFGYRYYVSQSIFNNTSPSVSQPEIYYHQHKIKHLIAEGFYDLLPEKAIPIEYNLEQMFDFKKGCYIGQEIIARAFYRGEIRKKIVLFELINTNKYWQDFILPHLNNNSICLLTCHDFANASNKEITFLSAIATADSAYGLALLRYEATGEQQLFSNTINILI
jgi:hypothetical protein